MQESRNFGNTLTGGTEVEDLNFIIRDLQYSSVLDVPFYTRILHQFYSFFGKINVSVSAPAFLGYIYYIVLVVQSFLPAFLIDCEDLWPRESLMTMILYVVGYVYQGPQNSIKSARVPMSFAVSLIFIILILILIFRARTFQKIGRVASIETKFILFTFKYIMPLFCPHLIAGTAISFNEIINDKKIGLNIVQIIFSVILFGVYIFLYHTVISPRVLLEDTPSHEWFPFLSVLGIINTTFLSLVSGIAGCIEGKNRAGCSIFMFIESALYGFTVFYSNGIIKMMISVVSSATSLASAVASIFVTVDLFLNSPLSPEILFVVSVIVYVVLIVVLRILKQMKVTKIMQYLDGLMDSGESYREILEQTYTRPSKFLSDLRLVVELWHPYLLTFDMFEFALAKWPDNFNVLILYARILSFFPNKNSQLMVVASMISKLPEKSSRNSYLYQLRHLARTRQTHLTKVVQQKLEEINSKKEVAMVLMRQFWENILQKNIVNFWTDSEKVHNHISELDSIFAQLIDDYPNNFKVIQMYLDFVKNLKRDHLEAREISKKMEILRSNGQIKSDLALELALLVFPNLHNYLQAVEHDSNQTANDVSGFQPQQGNEEQQFRQQDEDQQFRQQDEQQQKEEESNLQKQLQPLQQMIKTEDEGEEKNEEKNEEKKEEKNEEKKEEKKDQENKFEAIGIQDQIDSLEQQQQSPEDISQEEQDQPDPNQDPQIQEEEEDLEEDKNEEQQQKQQQQQQQSEEQPKQPEENKLEKQQLEDNKGEKQQLEDDKIENKSKLILQLNKEEEDNDVEDEDGEEDFGAKNKESNDQDIQIECALSELTKHSRLGRIWFVCIFISLMTVLSIVLFYLFYDYYVNKFVDKQTNALDFLKNIDMLVYELNFFSVNTVILPLTFNDTSVETHEEIFIKDREEFVNNIAPQLWEKNKLPPFALTNDILVDILSNVKDRFSKMIVALSLLDKDDPYVKQINYLFSEQKVGGIYSMKDIATQEISIAQEVLKYTTVKDFFKEGADFETMKNYYFLVYQSFSTISAIARLYASTSYESSLDGLNGKMILAILITLILITLPYLFQLFLLKIQSDSIAESFTFFPNTEIRSIINRFGKSSSKMDEDLTQVASLSHIGGNSRLNIAVVVLTFLGSFLVFIICALCIYFTARDFIDNATSISDGIYTLTPAFAALSVSFSQALRFYMITQWKDDHFPPTWIKNSVNNSFTTSNGNSNENITEILINGIGMLQISLSNFSTGMWGKDGGVGAFFDASGAPIDSYNDIFEPDLSTSAKNKSVFERLASASFFESIDLVTGYLSSILYNQLNLFQSFSTYLKLNFTSNAQDAFGNLTAKSELMDPLIYWFSNFSEINRTRIYFDIVEDSVLARIGTYKTTGQVCFIVVIVWQIFALLFMILYMIDRHLKIKQSLRFYHFLKPEIILQNQNALRLIETGKQVSETNDISYSNSDYIISQIDQGVAVTEKNLSITNFNQSFAQKAQMVDENLNGCKLTDIMLNVENDKTWENFIQHVNDALIGRHKCQFSENVSVQLKSGQISHFSCSATCLTPNGIPNESEISSVEKIAFLFEDNTEMFMREQLINQEKKHLTDMLANVMPIRIVHSFEASGEGMSFVVQSVTIGSIRVQVLKKFDQSTSDEFTFYNEIFDRFDEEIKEFDLLMKVHTFVHTYTYIGGLFSEVNKPERHAEESIRFALKLLKLVPELTEKYGVEIHLTFGVHTGGPVVAGVMSLSKPTFQIIGTVGEMANQLKTNGVPDQICISRAVYELIFSAGFNVQERGDTTIRGGKVIPTYLVRV